MLTVSATECHTEFRAILACSTTSFPTCVMWTEQDEEWDDVCTFLSEAMEVTDYVCVDYLVRDLVPEMK